MINLEVEEYCHGCRDFESDTYYDYAGEINNISIFCKHKNKCAQLKKYIERNTPVKTERPMDNSDLCCKCQYGHNGTGCRLLTAEHYTDDICVGCTMNDNGFCKCVSVDIYEKTCPYFKEAKNET